MTYKVELCFKLHNCSKYTTMYVFSCFKCNDLVSIKNSNLSLPPLYKATPGMFPSKSELCRLFH